MILPLQEHVLSYSMYLCIKGIFSICMLTYNYVSRFLLEEQKRAICITENDPFTSSCTLIYQGSYSNQHCYIIKRVKNEYAGLRFKIQQLIE